jgi:L-glyceraldehyde 3-phosphate reductase
MRTALEACGAPVVASYVLAGGVLSGKYDVDPVAGRAAGALDQPMYAAAATAARSLAQLAERLETTPASLAVAFALQNPAVATVLFGATTPAQIEQNVAALALEARLTAADRAELVAIGT